MGWGEQWGRPTVCGGGGVNSRFVFYEQISGDSFKQTHSDNCQYLRNN